MIGRMRSIWDFEVRVINRAWASTRDFFGWKKKTLIWPVLFFVGALIDFVIRGAEGVKG